MYQNLINSLKKILDSKATQAEKLLKISTLVEFADGLDRPYSPAPTPAPRPSAPTPSAPSTPAPQPQMVDAKKPVGPGPLLGVEDVK